MREAHARRDTRVIFYCLTPEAREIAVFDLFFACHTHRNTQAVLKRFGLDDGALNAEYERRYSKKHGVDMATWRAKHDQAMKKALEKANAADTIEVDTSDVPAPPPSDEVLTRQVVSDLVTDKPGFCEAVEKLIGRSDQPGPGRLVSLRIQGDTAVGHRNVTSYHLRNVGRGDEKVWTTQLTAICFRKVQGSWLIDMPQ
jgi:hypothetical protein